VGNLETPVLGNSIDPGLQEKPALGSRERPYRKPTRVAIKRKRERKKIEKSKRQRKISEGERAEKGIPEKNANKVKKT